MDENQNNTQLPPAEVLLEGTRIKNEDELQSALTEIKEKHPSSGNTERFVAFEDSVHEMLGRQDSESALSFITK
jgi:hypothetical protein